MPRSVLTRIGTATLQVLAVTVVVFACVTLLPGDTAAVVLGEDASPEQVANLRVEMGLDEPPHERFVEWLGGVFRGDLGTSLLTGLPVADEITSGLATTAVLSGLTLGIAIPMSVAFGVFTGLRPDSVSSRVLNSLLVMFNSIPEFALAFLLVGLFALQLAWLPATAAGTAGVGLGAQPALLVLPVTVLVVKQLCVLARQIRIGVVEANRAEYAAHVRTHGLPERTVVLRHVLPNALAPAVQQLARIVDGLLGGVVVVEAVFALSGLGSGFVEAVQARDLPSVQGYALVFAVTTVLLNLFADLVARRLTPQREAAG